MEEPNSNGPVDGARIDVVDELVLTYDRVAGVLTIGGRVINADVGLAICHQAARHFEQLLRVAAAQRLAAGAVEAARTQEILNRTRVGRI